MDIAFGRGNIMNKRTAELYDRTVFDNALRALQKLGPEKFADFYVQEHAHEAEALAEQLHRKLMQTRPSGG